MLFDVRDDNALREKVMYSVTLFMLTLIQKQVNFPQGPRTLNISNSTLAQLSPLPILKANFYLQP